MKAQLLLIIILTSTACTVSEYGTVTAQLCPSCPDAFNGFETCAFYEADSQWAREGMLIDDEQYEGVGIPIVVAGYMHHKFCFNETHATFGSANPTVSGLLVSNNIVITVASKTLAHNFASEYAYLQGDTSQKHTRTFFLNDQPVEHVFCPRHGCEEMLAHYIHNAEHEIIFLTFSFTSDAIAEALIAAHLRGVKVQGVFESWGAGSQYSQFSALQDAGIPVIRVSGDGVMHHKAFVVDDTAIVGSFNPSKNANTRNAETLVALKEPVVVNAVKHEFARLT